MDGAPWLTSIEADEDLQRDGDDDSEQTINIFTTFAEHNSSKKEVQLPQRSGPVT